jgi:hypothetical protein
MGIAVVLVRYTSKLYSLQCEVQQFQLQILKEALEQRSNLLTKIKEEKSLWEQSTHYFDALSGMESVPS